MQIKNEEYDELKYGKNKKVMKQIDQIIGKGEEREEVLFSCKVIKINEWSIRQDRIIVMTSKSLMNFKKENLQRRIMLKHIHGLSISKSSQEFVMHVPGDLDYRFSSEKRDWIIEHFLRIYCKAVSPTIRAYFFDEKGLGDITNRKKGVQKLPSSNFQYINQESWHTHTVLKEKEKVQRQWLLYQRGRPQGKKQVVCKDFNVLNLVGQGVVSKLYLVQHSGLNRLFVLKVVNKDKLQQWGQVDAEATRARIKAHVQHSFMVQLEWAFESEDNYLFYFKFYSNGDLFHHLSLNKIIGEQQARFYFIETACQLGMLHEKGDVYCDLKLENVLLDDEGHVCLSDLGVGRGMVYKQLDYTISTPEYLAPEVLRGGPYTRQSDWWCLGLMLYEMVMGLPPFMHPSQSTMFLLIQHAQPFFPQQCHLSQECIDIILCLLEKDPNQRLGSTNDLIDIKGHAWLAGVLWDQYKHKQVHNDSFLPQQQGPSRSVSFIQQSFQLEQSNRQSHDYSSLLNNFDQDIIRTNTLDFQY